MSLELAQEAPVVAAESGASAVTVGEILDAYMKEKRNPLSYRKTKHPESIALHLKAIRVLWGEMPNAEFRKKSRARVEDQVRIWREVDKWSLGTCRKRVSHLRAAFRHAVRTEMIDRNDEPTFELPPASPPRDRVLSFEELRSLIKAADDPATPEHIRNSFYLMLYTGQRIGAILALRWAEHIDMEKKVILFRETEAAEDRSKKRRVNQPMDAALFAYMEYMYERRDSNNVISWQRRPVKSNYFGFKMLLKRAGLSDMRRHDMRRSSATFVFAGTGDMQKAASHIGDSIAMAEAVYVQKSADTNLEGVKAVSSMIEKARAA